MSRALTCAEMRALEKRAIEEAGIPAIVLMENAGRAVASEAERMAPTGRIVAVCGRGNNAGDGFAAARHLDIAGRDVRVLVFEPSRLAGDALVNYRALRFSRVELVEAAAGPDAVRSAVAGASLVLDAVFGTGLSGPLREPWPAVVEAMNAPGVPILAVDVPSGLDADTGSTLGAAVRAARTVTFHAPKAGFAAARPFTGDVVVAAIGIPSRLS
ncbi:MAG: NAD(P)H-hydrate epimerase [Planctomycetia bacterium]|nr:NAD(P)H-hydrate epimerase [Planctomycetia bacterium]